MADVLKSTKTELNYAEILREFRYKPNFSISLYKFEGDWHIRISMWVEDSRATFRFWKLEEELQENIYGNEYICRISRPPVFRSPSRLVQEVTGNYRIPDGLLTEEAFLNFLIGTIHKLEDHEMYEWLRYKGQLIDDPHKEEVR